MTNLSPIARADLLVGSGPAGASPALARRALLGGGLGLAATALVGTPRAAAAAPVVGRIRDTYEAAGGEAVLGAPLAHEVRRRIGRQTTYGQRFAGGTVWWGSGVGKVDRPAQRVRLDTARNFRPALGVRDLWRTDDLDGCSALEKRVVIDLGIETMIAMNSGGDPSIPGVERHQYRISNAGSHLEFYRGYVSRSASRASVRRVLRRVARSDAPVLVHCAGGKDRTGWVCDLMQSVAGVAREVRDLDYLATRSYSGRPVELEWLDAARDELARRYGTVEAYLREGCDLSATDLRRLRARLS
ncbi:tyrosine-protein phosphatase [Microlunatus flavus]|uniref:Tyrosine phosphatase family protein n=1 Tax=Microlunatus flavus TaxID=1036181 RepID=A0A1H9N063_9ACTN|nr:tyrosine-protein phosphatase [Microlunatus flavus]SER29177.1 Tyrosine phosphatase family protein [Microlunatus flavus]